MILGKIPGIFEGTTDGHCCSITG